MHHALCMPRSTSMDRSALWLIFLPSYTNSFVWLTVCTLNLAGDFGIPFVRKHMISVLASDTVRPNAAHTTTTSPPSSLATQVVARRFRHRQPKAKSDVARAGSPVVPSPLPPTSVFPLKCTKVSMISLSALKRV